MSWSQWSSVSEGRAGASTSVTAVSIGDGRFALFVADPGGGVFTTAGNADRGWGPWSSVSEGHAGAGVSVTALPMPGGRFAVFLADPGGGVFATSGDAERGWRPWSSVSEGCAGAGTSVTAVESGGRFTLFVADPGGGVFTASGHPVTGWSPWSSVSDGHAGAGTCVTAVPIAGGRFAVFVADPSGTVFTTSGNADSGWDLWSHVSEGRAGPRSSVTAIPIGGDRCTLFLADPNGGVFTASGDSSSPIKHVFVLMMENRSFDHMLGFSGISGTDAATGQLTTIDGLNGTESNSFEDRTYTVSIDASDVMGGDPSHNFRGTLEQLCGPGVDYPRGGAYPQIKNSGFVSSWAKKAGHDAAGQIMKCFGPDQLPVLNALAREFVVCDRWFASMPGATQPNRMFVHAATCREFDDNPDWDETARTYLPSGGWKFRGGNIFQQLDKAGVKYRIYANDNFPDVAQHDDVSVKWDVEDFEELADDLNDSSFDVGYVFIEPSYDALDDFADGNSQHPLGSAAAGERFIKATYEAIRKSPIWGKSLLVIIWDEHGGFYDHVAPGSTSPTGSIGRTHGFTFEQLGPRIPAVIVSPLLPKNLIEHRVLEHASIPATLTDLFKLPVLQHARTGVNRLINVAELLPTPRADTPVTLAGVQAGVAARRIPFFDAVTRKPEASLSDDPHGNLAALIHGAVVQHLEVAPDQREAILARARQLQTRADALAYMKEVYALVRAERVKAGRRVRP
jgi:phospholipase C